MFRIIDSMTRLCSRFLKNKSVAFPHTLDLEVIENLRLDKMMERYLFKTFKHTIKEEDGDYKTLT